MATTWENETQASQPVRSRPKNGGGGMLLTFVVLLCGLAVGGWVLASSVTGGESADVADEKMTIFVTKGPIQVRVTEDGEVESAKPVLLKCLVSGGSQILEIVPDGTRIVAKGEPKQDPTDVEVGDQLVKLDDSKIKDALDKQRITVGNAQTQLIQAEKDLAVAKISITEYEQGTFVQELQGLDAEVTIAMENLRGVQNQYDYTQKMFRKGFVTKLQLEADEFAVKRSKLELQQSETKRTVLLNFTKAKMLEDFRSNVKTATQAVTQKQSALELEKRALERIGEQFANCVIVAPQPGMVVYHNERSRYGRSQTAQIEEGATVREHQAIVKLPDFTRMQVKVNVHESKVQQVAVGDRALLTIQGYKNPLKGKVIEIANQPETTSWYQAKVKEYATIVKIDEIPEGMVPGMSAEVVIDVERRDALLRLPVESVIEIGGKYFAWESGRDGYTRRELTVAKSQKGDNRILSDNKFIGVEKGVAEGDEIVLNPRDVVPEAKELIQKNEAAEAKKKSQADASASTSGVSGKALPSGGKGPRPAGGKSRKGGTAEAKGKAGAKRKGGGKRSGSGAGAGGSGFLKRLDKDGDGKVPKAEVAEIPGLNAAFDGADTDKDGFLDAAEFAKMLAAFKAARGGQ